MDKGIEALIGRMLEQTKRFDNVQITESEAKQLITELKRLDGRNANLNSTLESWATDRAESAQRIAELESAPNGMMQLSNELAEMKRKCEGLNIRAVAMLRESVRNQWLKSESLADKIYWKNMHSIANEVVEAIRAGGTVEGD